MKRLLIVCVLIVLAFTLSQAATQPCFPGERDVVYNDRILEDAWVTCVRTEYLNNVEGYLPIGANIEFQQAGLIHAGQIDGYQWTEYPAEWPVDRRKPFVYMVTVASGGYAAVEPNEVLTR
jgi:hypothetical protein